MDNSIKKRCFLICGHAQTGKTSLSEAILYTCQAITRLGRVEDGTTISDYQEDEKIRKSSINLSIVYGSYKDNFLQFIDTPGYLDFIGELIASVQAVDFAVIVVSASSGVEVGTEKAWEIVRKRNLPCLFFINQLDKEGSDYSKVVDQIRKELTKRATSFVIFDNNTVINVLKESQRASSLYNEIVEKVAESDDYLLEKYLEKGELDKGELISA